MQCPSENVIASVKASTGSSMSHSHSGNRNKLRGIFHSYRHLYQTNLSIILGKSNSQAFKEGKSSASNNDDLKVIDQGGQKSTVIKNQVKSIFSRPSQDEYADPDSPIKENNSSAGQLIDIKTSNFPNNIVNIGNRPNKFDKEVEIVKKSKTAKRKQRK